MLREHQVVDEPTLEWLAGYRFTGDIWGYAEGEIYFPYSPLMVVESTFAEAVLLETLLLSILNHDSAIAVGGVAHDLGRRWPAVHRDGVAAHPRGGRGGRRPRGVHRRLRRHLEPRGRPAATASRRPAPARTASRCCTTPSGTRSPPRSSSLGTGTTLLVDTYDVAEAVRLGGRGGRPRARCGTHRLAATSACSPSRSASSSTSSARPTPASSSPPTSTSSPSPLWRPPPSTATASARRWSPGSGHPTCGFVYKLVAREGDDGDDGRRREEEQGQDLDRRPEVRPAAPQRPRRRRGRGGRDRRAAGRRRRRPAAAGPAGPERRGGRPREPRDDPCPARRVPRRAAAEGPPALPRGTRHPDPARGRAERWHWSAATSSPRCSRWARR